MKRVLQIKLGLFLFFLIATLYSCGSNSVTSQAGQIATPASSPAPVHTLIVEPDDGRGGIIAALNKASKSICLTIYEINDPEIVAALQSAAARKVEVKVIYNYYSFSPAKRETILSGVASLESAGILTRAATSEFTVTHQKSFVIDGTSAIIMTFNLQPEYFGGTRDFGIVTTDPAEVAEICRVFNADWDYRPVTPTCEALVWSPVNSREKITSLIGASRVSLEVYNEEVEDRGCINALTREAAAGVDVRFISAQLMNNGYDGNTWGRRELNRGGVAANYGDFLYIHAKMVLADQNKPGARVYLGSENFSTTSLDHNRELGILLSEPEILARLNSIFSADWKKSKRSR
ncbi:MAG: hypothetical protein KKC80_07395 [Candidatus Margulisbacteria bacterium]|nr:hypothetical protein [Candidatus Margulisiibacteriota bacterium]MBU1617498.1 hypothetical protein [Candidatus Margulisiibacteriota bacterium]